MNSEDVKLCTMLFPIDWFWGHKVRGVPFKEGDASERLTDCLLDTRNWQKLLFSSFTRLRLRGSYFDKHKSLVNFVKLQNWYTGYKIKITLIWYQRSRFEPHPNQYKPVYLYQIEQVAFSNLATIPVRADVLPSVQDISGMVLSFWCTTHKIPVCVHFLWVCHHLGVSLMQLTLSALQSTLVDIRGKCKSRL